VIYRRVAFLCDVHGNVHALRAVLAEVQRVGCELVVFGGDLAAGAFPVETIDTARAAPVETRFVRGNCVKRLSL